MAQTPQTLQCDNLIQGQWVKGLLATEDRTSVKDGSKLGTVSVPTQPQIHAALESAHLTYLEWAQAPLKERARVLFKLRHLLNERLETIASLKAHESGKTLTEAKAGLLKGIEVLEFALSIQNLDLGGKIEVSRAVTCEYRREPLGVVANITPFNFPAMVPMWTMPIAIALGNAYVWKPSDKTPLTSRLIGQAWMDAGLPSGVLTILQGGESSANAIIEHPRVRAVGFVGSTRVAKAVYQRATSLGKRALCLGGAKNHIVLLPDADPMLSGQGISDSFTGCAGQRCMAASVVLAVGDVQKHIDQIVARASSLKLGHDMGAIITREQVDFLNSVIERAKIEGARILLDGRNAAPPFGFEKGNWIGPTILDQVKPGTEAATVELFGPILSVIRCQDLSQALSIQAQSEYGNACSVFTSSGAAADRVVRATSAGMVGINVGVPVPREPFSFGGTQASKFGQGDMTGRLSLDLWSDLKKITTKWEQQSDSNWMS